MPSVVFWVLVLENSFFGKTRHSVTIGFSDALLSEIYLGFFDFFLTVAVCACASREGEGTYARM